MIHYKMSDDRGIPDEKFIQLLHNLGVETYNKSFEWLFQDPDSTEMMHWIYNNLDQHNTLTPREEYRYAGLENKGKLLPISDLEENISALQNEFKGLCLPGDDDSLEDMKLAINMQKERLAMLEKHEEVLMQLIEQNEKVKDDLTIGITEINALQVQCTDDEEADGQECIQLAEDIETITNDVVNIINDTLNVYANCSMDKELAKRFFTYGPYESYRQSQTLFKSHFDLFTFKKFNNQNDTNNEDMRNTLVEAKNMEERLSDAVSAYIETKADLCGEQAKLVVISNYHHVHASQITLQSMEAQSAIELLEQEESILEQQLQHEVKCFIERRTNLAVQTTAKLALAVREQIYKDLSFLHNITQEALSVDRLVYSAVRRELQSIEELLHFADQLRNYELREEEVTADRVKSMNDICAEQEAVEKNLKSSNLLLHTLISIFGSEPSADECLPIKLFNELKVAVKELNDDIYEGYRKKEDALAKIKTSLKPLKDYVYDGCTRQPNCHDSSVSTLTHSLKQLMDAMDAKVLALGGEFKAVKSGDKDNLRKLWQYFLTDPAKFLNYFRNI